MAITAQRESISDRSGIEWRHFPWWLLLIIMFLFIMGTLIVAGQEFNRAFNFVIRGLSLTLYVTFMAFLWAMIIGLLAGLGRISQNVVIRTMAITYVEFVRGVPILVLIFTLAYVIVPQGAELIGLDGTRVSLNARGIAALSIIYGAFLAEVFRAGIESVPPGQMEAARSLGMTVAQALRAIILPQALRNISPALGNDFIAMLKDSSLMSVLAVREITQLARLYAGSSFRFRETYLVLTFLYLTMTISLSLLLRWYEARLRRDAR